MPFASLGQPDRHGQQRRNPLVLSLSRLASAWAKLKERRAERQSARLRWAERRAYEHLIRSLDEHMLRDIGLR